MNPTKGRYHVHLPDGRLQSVNYQVNDAESGFIADINYIDANSAVMPHYAQNTLNLHLPPVKKPVTFPTAAPNYYQSTPGFYQSTFTPSAPLVGATFTPLVIPTTPAPVQTPTSAPPYYDYASAPAYRPPLTPVPIQNNYNTPLAPVKTAPNPPAPVRPSYDLPPPSPVKPTYNPPPPVKPTYNTPATTRPTYNPPAPAKPTYNSPAKPTYNPPKLNKPTYHQIQNYQQNAPAKPTYKPSPVKSTKRPRKLKKLRRKRPRKTLKRPRFQPKQDLISPDPIINSHGEVGNFLHDAPAPTPTEKTSERQFQPSPRPSNVQYIFTTIAPLRSAPFAPAPILQVGLPRTLQSSYDNPQIPYENSYKAPVVQKPFLPKMKPSEKDPYYHQNELLLTPKRGAGFVPVRKPLYKVNTLLDHIFLNFFL